MLAPAPAMAMLAALLLTAAEAASQAIGMPGGHGGSAGEFDAFLSKGSSESCDCSNTDVDGPVCGSDGDTYQSPCHADCAGVTAVTPGRCLKGCLCPAERKPLCGFDGVTHHNDCLANCIIGLETAYPGECKPECKCDASVREPVCQAVPGPDGDTTEFTNSCYADCIGVKTVPGVCGTPGITCEEDCQLGGSDYEEGPACGQDGVTYDSGCLAHCADTEVAYSGPCDTQCDCASAGDAPVCGKNGVTYRNECEARCAPVAIAFEGVCVKECECKEDTLEPVCSNDGNTYLNECFLRCASAVLEAKGMCDQ